MTHNLKPGQWWQPLEGGRVLCTLCPRYCRLGPGQHGFCYVRKNISGSLYSIGYGRPTGFGLDPIEKKPLNHFLPGTSILSFGTAGCNLGCKFCQNWSMSKARIDDTEASYTTAGEVVKLAKKYNAPSIAYTYNDPVIFGEYVIDIARLAREQGIRSVMVTAGYISREACADVYRYIDAANVDLKAFSEAFYSKLTLSHLAPVLDTLKWLRQETDVWLELTTLLIPGMNDSPDELEAMCAWIIENLGDFTPLHFTAFHPSYKMRTIPRTPDSAVLNARGIALKAGLKYCYVGNIYNSEGQTTWCPGCKSPLIIRDWHDLIQNNLSAGKCKKCGCEIAGVFQ